MGQTPTRTQEIPPRIPHEPRTEKFLKTIGTGECDVEPSIRDFLIHGGSDFSYWSSLARCCPSLRQVSWCPPFDSAPSAAIEKNRSAERMCSAQHTPKSASFLRSKVALADSVEGPLETSLNTTRSKITHWCADSFRKNLLC